MAVQVVRIVCIVFITLYALLGWSQNGQPPAASEVETIEFESIQGYLAPFYYVGRTSRDPFSAPEVSIPLRPGRIFGPFLPLQKFELDELELKGVFWNIKNPRAIVRTPKGVNYHVGIKDYIGENFGYVAMIREKEVVVIQTIENQGQRYSSTKVLFLKKSRSKK